jgi:hypothetical protein|tara:strand:+ start:65 stop:526 length:462 start_codon:yes stop_codon:yes gene_type:complete
MKDPRFVPNEASPDLYRNYTMSFPGGSLTATRDVLLSIFKNDLLPSTCNPEEKTVSRKEYVTTKYPGADPSAIIKTDPYTLKNYSNGGNSRAAAGEPIKFLIDGSWWTARLVGSHQDFMDYLCDNTESLEGEATYWVSQKGSPYFVSHSTTND